MAKKNTRMTAFAGSWSPILLFSAFVLVPTTALADGHDGGRSGDWEFAVGAGAFYAPTFEGSDESEAAGLPFFSVTYGDKLSLGFDGLSYKFYDRGPLSMNAGIGYEFGRDESDDAHLTGLGDVDGGATLNFGADYAAGLFDLFVDVERSFGDSDGTVAKFGGEISRPVGPVLLGAGLSATWADGNHMQSYFGVTATQSASSGLAQYDAGSGIKRADLELSATYMFAENWMLRGQVEFGELLGDAADSPIVQDSSQTSVGLFVGYRF